MVNVGPKRLFFFFFSVFAYLSQVSDENGHRNQNSPKQWPLLNSTLLSAVSFDKSICQVSTEKHENGVYGR